jgi:hypothetical protein
MRDMVYPCRGRGPLLPASRQLQERIACATWFTPVADAVRSYWHLLTGRKDIDAKFAATSRSYR